MLCGQTLLDGVLAFAQPVHGSVQAFSSTASSSSTSANESRRVSRCTRAVASLEAGLNRRERIQREQVAHPGAATEQVIEALACEGAQGGDMAVGLGAHDVEGIMEGGDGQAALQDAQAFDEVSGPFGEVGEGAFFDLAVLAVGLARTAGGEERLGTDSTYMATAGKICLR